MSDPAPRTTAKSHSDYDTEDEREAFRDGWQAGCAEINRLRGWLIAIGNLADVDADERGWMVEHALDGKAAPDV